MLRNPFLFSPSWTKSFQSTSKELNFSWVSVVDSQYMHLTFLRTSLQGSSCWAKGCWCFLNSVWWTHPCDGSWLSQVASIHSCLLWARSILLWLECYCWDILCWCSFWSIQDPHFLEGCYWLWVRFGSRNQDPWFDQGWIPYRKIPFCWSGWWKEHLG